MSQITTVLTITSSGKYSYDPNSVTVTKTNTTLIYALSSKSAAEWEIVGLTTTDSKNQVSNETKAPTGDSISILDANTVAETFDVTVVAQHRTQRDRLLRIDPEVLNTPE